MTKEYIYLVTDEIQLTPICEDCGPNLVPVMRKEELIRCRECKHWERSLSNVTKNRCTWTAYIKEPDGFCDWAERRKE